MSLSVEKADARAQQETGSSKRRGRWPLWKKAAVGAAVLLAVVALAVGLGVGLTRNHHSGGGGGGGSKDDDGDGDGSEGHDTRDTSSPNRTSIWTPSVGTPWQIILKYPLPELTSAADAAALAPADVDVWDIDLFDNSAATIAALRDAGKRVVCYFSAGSYENWRGDAGEFAEADLGEPLDGWEGERWLDVRSGNVRRIMAERVELAWKKGCDAIDPDNVDGYENNNGLDLTPQDSISFIHNISAAASAFNLSTGLKNARAIIPSVLDAVAFSVNEQCAQYSECDAFQPFIDAGKPVFHIEYPEGAGGSAGDVGEQARDKACAAEGFSTVVKEMSLEGWVMYCDGSVFETEVQK